MPQAATIFSLTQDGVSLVIVRCPYCGALTRQEDADAHQRWHDDLSQALRRLSGEDR